MEENKTQYRVIEKRSETADVVTLRLSRENGSVPSYHAGQYINIYFPDTKTPEGKAYSISSAPKEGILEITVKKMGEFSHRLCALEPGDTVVGSEPYGFFYSESDDTPLVMLASGIGITPFRSMIRESLTQNPERKLLLFYSSRTAGDIIFKNELRDWQAKNKNFTVVYFITREKNTQEGVVEKRMSAKQIMNHEKTEKDAEFLICGSISFVRDMWKGLKSSGVSEERIYTEAFFSH